MDELLWRLFFWLLAPCAAFFVLRLALVDLPAWRLTTKLYGRFPRREAIAMFVQSLRTRGYRRFTALGVPCLAVGIPLWIVMKIAFGRPDAYLFGCYLLVYCIAFCVALSLSTLPASVLLLGTSRWETVRLMERIELAVRPRRIALLVDRETVQPERHSWGRWQVFKQHNLWVVADDDWHTTVFKLAKAIPLIVLDTRAASPAVVKETEMILANEALAEKTIFVADQEGRAAAIDASDSELSFQELELVPEVEIVVRLRSRGFHPSCLAGGEDIRTLFHSRRLSRVTLAIGHGMVRLGHALGRAHASAAPEFLSEAVTVFRVLMRASMEFPSERSLAGLTNDIGALAEFLVRWEPQTRQRYYRNVLAEVRNHFARHA